MFCINKADNISINLNLKKMNISHLFFSFLLMFSCNKTFENNNSNQRNLIVEIQGTWVVHKIKNVAEKLLLDAKSKPVLQIEGYKVSGNNGCNTYFSSITKVSKKSFTFTDFGQTRMACLEMNIPDAFIKNLEAVTSYSLSNNTLKLYNSHNENILSFTKKQGA